MDPVGPWSAYASYNRLAAAGVQSGTNTSSAAEHLHHHLSTTTASAPATSAAQLLSGGFLSPPPPVGYETVFSPLFHHAAAAGSKPPAHYVSQQRVQALAQQVAAAKQTDGEFHQPATAAAAAFFEQGAAGTAWQQNSPFGILPHESVVTTSGANSKSFENFTQFANSQLANVKSSITVTRTQSPSITTKPNTSQSASFFQVPDSSTTNASKTFASCIVSSPTPITARVNQMPSSRVYLTSPPTRNLKPQAATNQIQNKPQTKIYETQTERQRTADETQSSPISFSIMDVPGRLNYSGSNSSAAKRPQFQQQQSNYRHYQNSEDFQRPKSGSEFSNGPDCNVVVVPRRPSPLQAHSQPSPIGHAPSPAYPMYNSPMNSISSPQNSSQVAPHSPLDVSVSRSNSNSGVAYSSVITRTDQQQNCWDERQQQQQQTQRKFSTNNYNSNSANVVNSDTNNQHRTNNLNDRQAYFDSNSGHQVTLQDLSSCRGDPMSIVKNLQQQQSCLVQHADLKQDIKPPTKRRKSVEKSNTQSDPSILHNTGRIPPPAHSAALNNNQQQNGAPYFEFDRWNIPPTAATKLFATQSLHQQHQGLMVPHPHTHHAPPPLPYFAPFHLGTHPVTDFPQSSVELTPLNNYHHNDAQYSQQQQHQQQQQQQEGQPKVVVPNIEEELNFLSEDTTKRTIPTNTSQIATPIVPTPVPKPPVDKQSSGFMSSYLKFLQGERDCSPPPTVRGGGRGKQNYTRPKAQIIENKTITNSSSSEHIMPTQVRMPVPPPPQPQPPPHMAPQPVVPRITTQGDPQDDPRYFPLPKERKMSSFNSSDDGFSSDDEFFRNRKKTVSPTLDGFKEKNAKKTRSKSAHRKRIDNAQRQLERELKELQKEKLKEAKLEAKAKQFENIPRRETSKRAAKEKSDFKNILKNEEDIEEPPEFQDSDSDPAWTPIAKDDDDEGGGISLKKGRRGKSAPKPRKGGGVKNLIAAAAQGAGINDLEEYSNDNMASKTKKNTKPKPNTAPTLEDNIAASMQNNVSNATQNENPFKPGEFVVVKSDLQQDWPSIWRVDGKTLLQKYESFQRNGATLYKNISTYTSWTPESRKQYILVPVRYISENQMETVVELLKNEITTVDPEFKENSLQQLEVYQDNFEVYIQTLISQALDSNFLLEIFQEKDEYFLTNVQKIDEITNSRKQKLLNMLRWPPSLQAAVCTWPCINIIRELNNTDKQTRNCAACLRLGVEVRMIMYGQPYNSTTLEGCSPDPNAINEKDFFMCRLCAKRVELSNKVTHQKYLMYIKCAKRVAEKRTLDPSKDTTCILNELLADETWLNQLFLEIRTLWTEIDCMENSYKKQISV